MFGFWKKYKETASLRKFRIVAEQMYETKKIELLQVHRENKNQLKITQLVTEINILCVLLEQPQIDIKNISDTVKAYPSLVKE